MARKSVSGEWVLLQGAGHDCITDVWYHQESKTPFHNGGTRGIFSLVSHLFLTSVSNKQLSKLYHVEHMHTRLEKITHVSAPCAICSGLEATKSN